MVIDASVLIDAFSNKYLPGVRARRALREFSNFLAPDVAISETFAGLRGLWIRDELSTDELFKAVDRLIHFPMRIVPNTELIISALDHRHNVGAGDSLYVALAESENCPIITSDSRLSRATGISCEVILLLP